VFEETINNLDITSNLFIIFIKLTYYRSLIRIKKGCTFFKLNFEVSTSTIKISTKADWSRIEIFMIHNYFRYFPKDLQIPPFL
jgi:hypothetical protein